MGRAYAFVLWPGEDLFSSTPTPPSTAPPPERVKVPSFDLPLTSCCENIKNTSLPNVKLSLLYLNSGALIENSLCGPPPAVVHRGDISPNTPGCEWYLTPKNDKEPVEALPTGKSRRDENNITTQRGKLQPRNLELLGQKSLQDYARFEIEVRTQHHQVLMSVVSWEKTLAKKDVFPKPAEERVWGTYAGATPKDTLINAALLGTEGHAMQPRNAPCTQTRPTVADCKWWKDIQFSNPVAQGPYVVSRGRQERRMLPSVVSDEESEPLIRTPSKTQWIRTKRRQNPAQRDERIAELVVTHLTRGGVIHKTNVRADGYGGRGVDMYEMLSDLRAEGVLTIGVSLIAFSVVLLPQDSPKSVKSDSNTSVVAGNLKHLSTTSKLPGDHAWVLEETAITKSETPPAGSRRVDMDEVLSNLRAEGCATVAWFLDGEDSDDGTYPRAPSPHIQTSCRPLVSYESTSRPTSQDYPNARIVTPDSPLSTVPQGSGRLPSFLAMAGFLHDVKYRNSPEPLSLPDFEASLIEHVNTVLKRFLSKYQQELQILPEYMSCYVHENGLHSLAGVLDLVARSELWRAYACIDNYNAPTLARGGETAEIKKSLDRFLVGPLSGYLTDCHSGLITGVGDRPDPHMSRYHSHPSVWVDIASDLTDDEMLESAFGFTLEEVHELAREFRVQGIESVLEARSFGSGLEKSYSMREVLDEIGRQCRERETGDAKAVLL
ncbi:hypothetical protein F5146DRAFT_1210015 [Armillaria mellea]|nr:hypothetical protein F5146DRAFT_1210015 [Armillaria mellea]